MKKYIITALCVLALVLAVHIAPAEAGSGTVTQDGVNVRSGPGLTYNIINTLTKGTGVTIIETQAGWQHIQFGSLKAG
ncbi:SH3 domain-containing protein [Syntrophomonas palmitatica]|uniref:SH3 domain-containing protein n=1 Tax=Syntrophomonas palmitatica TaxID=402877 RepID=UPI0006D204B5|nr:SH3 domain-containing protein [Syntrophomonas palmitatica]